MIQFIWNVHGLKDPSKARQVQTIKVENKAFIFALFETRVRKEKFGNISRIVCNQWPFFS